MRLASTATGKTCGMSWAWIAIRLTARSVFERAVAAPRRARRSPTPTLDADRDQVAVLRVFGRSRGIEVLAELLLVDWHEAPAPPQRAEDADRAGLAVDDSMTRPE